MKIRVQRRDGSVETLDLKGDQRIYEPVEGGQGCMSGQRMEHFFTVDGHYDGWGMSAPPSVTSLEDATDIIEQVEQRREIEQ